MIRAETSIQLLCEKSDLPSLLPRFALVKSRSKAMGYIFGLQAESLPSRNSLDTKQN
jgi:hypothetical protein